jgi:hypothetical protein
VLLLSLWNLFSQPSSEHEDACRGAVVGRLELANALPQCLLDGLLESLRIGQLVDCSEFGKEKIHGKDQCHRKESLAGLLNVQGGNGHGSIGKGNILDLPRIESKLSVEKTELLVGHSLKAVLDLWINFHHMEEQSLFN